MRTIDITTTQKVTIEYELAFLRDRIFAFIIDLLIIRGVFSLMWLFMVGLFSPDYFEVLSYVVLAPVFIFYTLVSEILMDGQTLGKKIIGIKVVKLNGKEPTVSDFIIRWVFRMVDIYFSAGAIASLLISSSNHSQRLGGMASNTTVIRVKFNLRFALEDILKISSLDDYEPTYPEVRQFSEQDMLLIKNIVARSRRYPNEAHKEAVQQLVYHLKNKLGLPEVPSDKTKFLKTLIRDYIVLTR